MAFFFNVIGGKPGPLALFCCCAAGHRQNVSLIENEVCPEARL